MKLTIPVLCAAVVLLAGCGDKSSDKPVAATNGASPSGGVVSAPGDYVNGLVGSRNRAIKTTDIASLNEAAQMYNVQEGHFPKDLNELVEAKMIARIPEAPPGMKLDYDPATGKVSVVPAQ
jgi:hypothetical protein